MLSWLAYLLSLKSAVGVVFVPAGHCCCFVVRFKLLVYLVILANYASCSKADSGRYFREAVTV